MSTVEIGLAVLVVVVTVASLALAFQNRAIAREGRGIAADVRSVAERLRIEANDTRTHLATSLDGLLALQRTEMQALADILDLREREAAEHRAQLAAGVVRADEQQVAQMEAMQTYLESVVARLRKVDMLPKPHRCQFTSDPTRQAVERTNRRIVTLSPCVIENCGNVHRDERPEDTEATA